MIFSGIQDEFGRKFEVLRLSVNSSCNFACTYCVSEEEVNSGIVPSHSSLSSGQFVKIVTGLHSLLNLRSVRITGGEPTMFPDLQNLISGLKAAGIPEVKLTTNGYLLKKMASALRSNGLDSLNISL
ncbi:MAG: radical SAM protein, partial [Leptospira sp.]|nr:radical SAM protein [Leptospira sp.]